MRERKMFAAAVIASWCVALAAMADGGPTTQPQGQSAKTAAAAVRQVAHIKIGGRITEGPAPFMLLGGQDQRSLHSYLERLHAAAADKELDGVIVTLDSPQMSWSQMLELRAAFKDVRGHGKTLWAFVESADSTSYMLAAAADDVSVAPAGGVELVGLHAELMFFRGLLDKIGVRADMIQVGQFKGADEAMTRAAPSPQLLGEINRMLDGLYAQMVDTVASSRNLKPEQVRALIDRGPFLAEAALRERLVDRVAGRGEVVDALKKQLGGPVAIRSRYGLPEAKGGLDLSNPFAIFKLFRSRPSQPSGDRIALVYIDGAIGSGESEDGLFGGRSIGSESIRKAVDRAGVDPGVKAIVVRIDSPGGSALASDVIWTSLNRAAAAKPVIVSVGGMAASGGYYIASAGQVIYAEPTSIVGSIGVVGGKVVLGPLFDKIGITTTSLTRGANADLFNNTVPFTDRQRAVVRGHMERVYAMFLDRVRNGRGGKIENLDSVAQGRIFVGAEAKRLGLVDRIGGLDDAIRFAAGRAKTTKYTIEVTPAPKTLFDVLSGAMSEADASALATWQRSVLGGPAQLQLLGELAPEQLMALSRQLILLRQLSSEQVLAAWPAAVRIE